MKKSIPLKEIVGFLPYGIKCKIIESPLKDEIHVLSGINYDGLASLGTGGRFGFIQRGFRQFKPIVRPLSDLTKEITINREFFIPIDELSQYVSQQTDNGINGLEWRIISTFPYKDIQKLHEWHFDVYDWIKDGLAIDINTL